MDLRALQKEWENLSPSTRGMVMGGVGGLGLGGIMELYNKIKHRDKPEEAAPPLSYMGAMGLMGTGLGMAAGNIPGLVNSIPALKKKAGFQENAAGLYDSVKKYMASRPRLAEALTTGGLVGGGIGAGVGTLDSVFGDHEKGKVPWIRNLVGGAVAGAGLGGMVGAGAEVMNNPLRYRRPRNTDETVRQQMLLLRDRLSRLAK